MNNPFDRFIAPQRRNEIFNTLLQAVPQNQANIPQQVLQALLGRFRDCLERYSRWKNIQHNNPVLWRGFLNYINTRFPNRARTMEGALRNINEVISELDILIPNEPYIMGDVRVVRHDPNERQFVDI